ncbi:hypothetical protein Pmani_023113 [Petrolisthes manimaculis]|uniref:DUF4789 domain-containing protein n=1 Tax=Petrolisthes manimaculis TaxID=1843537 RepID=A0AAE1U3M2_9EUCA|nr:hypothetical protein Pmani_023113 [Petrolisthes manimaculis]
MKVCLLFVLVWWVVYTEASLVLPPSTSNSDKFRRITFTDFFNWFLKKQPQHPTEPTTSTTTTQVDPDIFVIGRRVQDVPRFPIKFNLHSITKSNTTPSSKTTSSATPSSSSEETVISRVVFPGEGRTSSILSHQQTNDDNSTSCVDQQHPALLGLPAIDQDTNSTATCTLSSGQVMHNGTCKRLLAQETCVDGEWLVLVDNDNAECRPRPCPYGQLEYNGECVTPENTNVCGYGKILYVEMTGETYCDCEQGSIYDAFSGNCYARYEQGPCTYGNYLDRTVKSNCTTMECVPNDCEVDGFISGRNDTICYRKMYSGFCESAYHLFHQGNQTVECAAILYRNVFDVATLRTCPEGSLRDHLQQCRRLFHIPSDTSYPSLYGDCSTGFIKDPRGICRRVHNMFG